MTDLSVWTEGQPPPTGQRHRRRKKKDRRGGLAVVLSLVLILVVVGGGSALAFGAGSKLKDMFHSTSAGDYPGPGSGSVQIEVVAGQSVAQIATHAEGQGRHQDASTPSSQVANAEPDASSVQPGFYAFQRKMTAADALATLLDPNARIEARVTLPEGLRLDETPQEARQGDQAAAGRLREGAQERRVARPARPTPRATPRASSTRRPTTSQPDATAERRTRAAVRRPTTPLRDKAGVSGPTALPTRSSSSPAWSRPRPGTPRTTARSPGSSTTGWRRGCRCSSTRRSTTRSTPTSRSSPTRIWASTRRTTPTRTRGCRPAPINSPGLAALQAAVNPTRGGLAVLRHDQPQDGRDEVHHDLRGVPQVQERAQVQPVTRTRSTSGSPPFGGSPRAARRAWPRSGPAATGGGETAPAAG